MKASEGDLAIRTFLEVREATERLTTTLTPEDQLLQSMPSCSPTKWHRAHTTWFFETFILAPRGIPPFDSRYGYLFNSYYEAIGPRHARPKRGMLSRPSFEEIRAYRRAVDGRMIELLSGSSDDDLATIIPLANLGLAHEEQHQELILTDILNAFHENPTLPAFQLPPQEVAHASATARAAAPLDYSSFPGGLVQVGNVERGFAFDNEGPRHKVWLEPFQLSRRLVTVQEMKAFIQARGYTTPALWLSEGYEFVKQHDVRAPLYWRSEGDAWLTFGLHGLRELRDDEPVSHLSYYEADALAQFLGARLPSEQEWEIAAQTVRREGNFVESGALRPLPALERDTMSQMFGDAWEWTRSSYEPYPGYRATDGALGEYNGKFMVNQRVLRGGSCFTPTRHMRATYRNFWHPDTRFQATGVRLAKDT